MIDLSPEEAQQVLEDGYFAHVACAVNDEPYVTPMSYAMIDGVFYFRTGEGRRTDVLRRNPSVCIEVTRLKEGNAWESAIFWGEAVFIDDLDTRASVVQALLQKYHDETPFASSSPSPLEEVLPIVSVAPERLTGRASGGGFGAKTRPGRL